MTVTETPVVSWFIRHRERNNRVLGWLSVGVILVAVGMAAFGLASFVSALVWLGAALVVLALPWTDWLRYETRPEAWHARDRVGGGFRPPVL